MAEAYFTPYIDGSGFHMPDYLQIRDGLVSEARRIFGQDIYLENDSQDYEFISLMADKIHDAFLTAQLVYNNRSPATAIGAALDGIVKLNGIKRKSATRSVCKVIITGTPETVIRNGVVTTEYSPGELRQGTVNWDLPAELVIPETGELETTATCQEYGAVYAGL